MDIKPLCFQISNSSASPACPVLPNRFLPLKIQHDQEGIDFATSTARSAMKLKQLDSNNNISRSKKKCSLLIPKGNKGRLQ